MLRGVGSGRGSSLTFSVLFRSQVSVASWHNLEASHAPHSTGIHTRSGTRRTPREPWPRRWTYSERGSESHCWAATPGRARALHRRNSPWRPSLRPTNGLGYAGAHNLPISGAPRACLPTVRAGGVKRRQDLNALSPQALRRPGSARPSMSPDWKRARVNSEA
jgi:hypothetical protein